MCVYVVGFLGGANISDLCRFSAHSFRLLLVRDSEIFDGIV